MQYLIVSCTLFDGGGLAMIKGAMNGIKKLDPEAEFRSLHRPVHHREGILGSFEEPRQNEEAFEWADIILDIGGLCDNQSNKYDWLRLWKKTGKPYVWMSQSFRKVDRNLLEGTTIFARGERAAAPILELGIEVTVAADLSFLVEPLEWTGVSYRYAFNTHVGGKQIERMYGLCDVKRDIQIITKPFRKRVWEPDLGIPQFHGEVEEYFGLIAAVEEAHLARYQCICAAILTGTPFQLYITKDELYNQKYQDLLDFAAMDISSLKVSAMLSCQGAVSAAKGTL